MSATGQLPILLLCGALAGCVGGRDARREGAEDRRLWDYLSAVGTQPPWCQTEAAQPLSIVAGTDLFRASEVIRVRGAMRSGNGVCTALLCRTCLFGLWCRDEPAGCCNRCGSAWGVGDGELFLPFAPSALTVPGPGYPSECLRPGPFVDVVVEGRLVPESPAGALGGLALEVHSLCRLSAPTEVDSTRHRAGGKVEKVRVPLVATVVRDKGRLAFRWGAFEDVAVERAADRTVGVDVVFSVFRGPTLLPRHSAEIISRGAFEPPSDVEQLLSLRSEGDQGDLTVHVHLVVFETDDSVVRDWPSRNERFRVLWDRTLLVPVPALAQPLARSGMAVGGGGAEPAMAQEPAEALKVLEELNGWCAAQVDDCDFAERPEAHPGRGVARGEIDSWIAAHRARLAAFGVVAVWDLVRRRFVTQAEWDLGLMIGGNFAVDHLGDLYGAIERRAHANAARYLGVLVERVVGATPDTGWLSSRHVAFVIATLRAEAPAEAVTAARRLLPLHEAALRASSPPPADDANRADRLRERVEALRALARPCTGSAGLRPPQPPPRRRRRTGKARSHQLRRLHTLHAMGVIQAPCTFFAQRP